MIEQKIPPGTENLVEKMIRGVNVFDGVDRKCVGASERFIFSTICPEVLDIVVFGVVKGDDGRFTGTMTRAGHAVTAKEFTNRGIKSKIPSLEPRLYYGLSQDQAELLFWRVKKGCR